MKNVNKYLEKKNLVSNALTLKKALGGAKICAVLKSDAYGHGLVQTAKTLCEVVDFFAVLNMFEAKKILHLKKPILMLEKPTKQSFEFAIKNGVHSAVFCKTDLMLAEKVAQKLKKPCKVHIKLNTGMNRMGVSDLEEFLEIEKFVKNSNFLKQIAVFTHFGSGKGARTNKQFEKLEMFLSHAPKNTFCHFANTEISSFVSPQKNQMARMGLAFFGFGNFKGLKPVMSVFAKVVGTSFVAKGDFVGYGNKHKAKTSMKIAVLAIGYANGLLRNYHKKGFVLLHDKKAKIVADICMNMTIVDITNIPEAKTGDFAIVLGKSKSFEITATDMAKKCKTIPYEILTNFERIPLTKTKPVA